MTRGYDPLGYLNQPSVAESQAMWDEVSTPGRREELRRRSGFGHGPYNPWDRWLNRHKLYEEKYGPNLAMRQLIEQTKDRLSRRPPRPKSTGIPFEGPNWGRPPGNSTALRRSNPEADRLKTQQAYDRHQKYGDPLPGILQDRNPRRPTTWPGSDSPYWKGPTPPGTITEPFPQGTPGGPFGGAIDDQVGNNENVIRNSVNNPRVTSQTFG